MNLFPRLLLLAVLAAAPAFADEGSHNGEPFDQWLNALRQEAQDKGISKATLDAALTDIAPIPEIIDLDRKQPETTLTLDEYLDRVVTGKRIAQGRELLQKNHALLDKISSEYHVQPEIIVSLWGIETSFGHRTGDYSVVESLATLAYDGRRSDFFRSELFKALSIIDAGDVSASDMKGSWAGAMGQCQFMPSSFLNFAVDYNHDGHRDIWNSEDDVFASIANYLSSSGWDAQSGWTEDDANYKVLLKWNRSRYFATAVGQLAERIGE